MKQYLYKNLNTHDYFRRGIKSICRFEFGETKHLELETLYLILHY